MAVNAPEFASSARRVRAALALAVILLSASFAILPAVGMRGANAGPGATDAVVLGAGLVLLSLLGIVAALRPRGCNRLLGVAGGHARAGVPASAPPGCIAQGTAGHHPDCGAFSTHTIRIGGRIACAGCTGMIAGGGAGVLLGVVVALALIPPGSGVGAAIALFGVILASAGVVGTYRGNATPGGHVLGGFALVAGLAALVAGLSTAGTFPGAFGLAASVSVLGLRIDLSRLRHASACTECTVIRRAA